MPSGTRRIWRTRCSTRIVTRYRFLADEVHTAGFNACERMVWKRCSENGWWSAFGKKKAQKRSRPGTPSHDDLVRREFTADAPNRLWLADITEHRTAEGKLYACAVKDMCSRTGPSAGRSTNA